MKKYMVYPACFIEKAKDIDLGYVNYNVLWFQVFLDKADSANGPLVPMLDPLVEIGSGIFDCVHLFHSTPYIDEAKKVNPLFTNSNCTVVVSSDIKYHISQVELVLPQYLKFMEFREVNANFIQQVMCNFKESPCNK